MPKVTHEIGPVAAEIVKKGIDVGAELTREGFALARELFGFPRKPRIRFSTLEDGNGIVILKGEFALSELTMKANESRTATIKGVDVEGNVLEDLSGVTLDVTNTDTSIASGALEGNRITFSSPDTGGVLGTSQVIIRGTLPNGSERLEIVNVTVVPGDLEGFRLDFDAPAPPAEGGGEVPPAEPGGEPV